MILVALAYRPCTGPTSPFDLTAPMDWIQHNQARDIQ